MIPKVKFCQNAPFANLAENELLVVLGENRDTQISWIQELRKKSLPSLSNRIHNMQLDLGFNGEKGAYPFAVCAWDSIGSSSLERRYVAQKALIMVQGIFNCKKIAFYLGSTSRAEDLAICEDFLFRNTDPMVLRSNYATTQIFCSDSEKMTKLDPLQNKRTYRQWQYRHWVNENPDVMTSIRIGTELQKFAQENGCEFRSLAEDELRKLGLNLLLAVGGASELSPPRLHLVSKNLDGKTAPLLLIGKGITFDTGGINLKAHENFVYCMKNDMAGAALMSQIFMGLIESGYDKPIVLAIPSCENLIAQKAMKPGAIVKSYRGHSVYIEHTDAEGRLILVDAMGYAQDLFKPKQTIIAATLTTAALRQFTNFFTPVHFADVRLQELLTLHSQSWGEGSTFWGEFLPFALGNLSNAADYTNMGRMPASSNIGGGSNVAAHFLKAFSQTPLTHIDIFATAWNWSNDYPGASYGATGAPFNSLFYAIKDL